MKPLLLLQIKMSKIFNVQVRFQAHIADHRDALVRFPLNTLYTLFIWLVYYIFMVLSSVYFFLKKHIILKQILRWNKFI